MAQTIKLKRSATQGASPTTSQLELGEVAINTYDGKMYIKKNVGGTESIVEVGGGSGGGLSSSFTLYEYTATANQTTFSGSDSNSNTLAYDTGTPPKILVYLNGVLLDHTTDYTATNGTSVVLTSGAAASDLVQVAAYKSESSVALDIDLADNVKLKFGDDDDLQIYHDGSNSYIDDAGTGGLYLRSDNFRVLKGDGSERMIQADDDGAVLLYYDGSAKIQTSNDGVTVTGDVEADEFIGDVRGAVLFKAQAGEALAKGEVVYISGISGNTTIVSKADANDASKMPAFGLVAAAASSGNPVDIYTNGILSDIDTSAYSEGDELFVSTTAGALTATAPTGESSALQKIGKVTRSNATSGSIFIVGAGRSNAVPNLNEGRLFVGNSSNQAVADDTVHVDIANSRVGIGTTSPNYKLDVVSTGGGINIGGTGAFLRWNSGDIQIKNEGSYKMGFYTYNSSDAALNRHMVIDTNGYVGIGTASPAVELDIKRHTNPYPLRIGSSQGEGRAIVFADVAGTPTKYNWIAGAQYNINDGFEITPSTGVGGYTFSNPALAILQDGNVGIGTTSPSYKLDVSGEAHFKDGSSAALFQEYSNGMALWLDGSNGDFLGGDYFGIHAYGTTSLDFSYGAISKFSIGSNGNVGIGTSSPGYKLDISGTTNFGDTTYYNGGTAGLISWNNNLKFKVRAASNHALSLGAGGTEDYLYINTSGNVGIGTTSPASLLHVQGSNSSAGDLYTQVGVGNTPSISIANTNSTTDNTNAALYFRNDGGERASVGARFVSKSTEETELRFSTTDSSAATRERVTIKGDGKVGIGTTSPSQKLDVAGIIKSGGIAHPEIELVPTGSVGNADIRFDGTSLDIRSNSSSAYLTLQTATTERLKITNTGNFEFNSGNFTEVGTISSGAITSTGISSIGSQTLYVSTDNYVGINTSAHVGTVLNVLDVDDEAVTLRLQTNTNSHQPVLRMNAKNSGGNQQYADIKYNPDSPSLNFHVPYNESTPTLKIFDGGVTIDGTISSGNITTTGYLRGPSTFTIDPATHGDDTGTVVIAGNLQVDGTTTTINSTTLTVDDLNITLASGSANSAAANGAGITVDIANNTNPTLLYNGTLDTWEFNKRVDVTSEVRLFRSDGTRSGSILHNTSGTVVRTNSNGDNLYLQAAGTGNVYIQPTQAGYSTVINEDGIDSDFRVESDGNTHAFFLEASSGNVGIGTSNPGRQLTVEGTSDAYIKTDATSHTSWTIGSDTYGFLIYDDDVGGTDGYRIVVRQNSGNVGVGTTQPQAKFQVEEAGIDTTTTSTTATTQVAIDSFQASAFRSARYTIQVTNSTDSTYHITEILLIHDGTTPQITEYGTIFTGSAEATFDADISSGNVRLLATPATTDSMTFKVVRHCITV